MERMQTEDQDNSQLDGLFAAYREACPDPESTPDFMPNLWRKIEARRVDTTSIFKRLAHVCMAATAALLLLTTFLTPTAQTGDDEVLLSSTYADVLAADHAATDYVEALPADLAGDNR
jgi:hypothetical protein